MTQQQYLRFDWYLNDKESLIAEDVATVSGFDNCLASHWVVFQSVADEIAENGYAKLTPEQIADPDMQEILWDVWGREVTESDEVIYAICLWQRGDYGDGELIKSHITRAALS